MPKKVITIVIIIGCVVWAAYALAQMSSGNYIIESDSLNVAGLLATSSNYRLDETVGEIATGETGSSGYKMKAGYQRMQETYIAISAPSQITMAGTIIFTTGGSSTGSGDITVITDSQSGYTLNVKAGSSPALTIPGDSFSDYTPQVAGTPDFNWNIAASAAEFGFSPQGSHIVQRFRDDGSACNTGNNDSVDACWSNFSTTDQAIAQSYSANHRLGTVTTIQLKAEMGSSHPTKILGTYRADLIFTAIAN